MDPELEKLLLRVDHYISVFNLIGQVSLSRYFSLLKKRMKSMVSADELNSKIRLLREIKLPYNSLIYNNYKFYGSYLKTDSGIIVFTGVIENLLYIEGFKYFEELRDTGFKEIGNSVYNLSSDGVLIAELSLKDVDNSLLPVIENYQEFISISDLDQMSEISLSKYIKYNLEKFGYSVREEVTSNSGIVFDLVANIGNTTMIIELKNLKPRNISKYNFAAKSLSVLNSYAGNLATSRTEYILVTNIKIPDELRYEYSGIRIIDRDILKIMIKGENVWN